MSYCDQVSDSGLEIVVRRFKVLQSLKFQHFQGTGERLKQYYEENRRTQAEKMEELCFPACRYVSFKCFLNVFNIFLADIIDPLRRSYRPMCILFFSRLQSFNKR